ncbi:Annexin family and Annexin, type III family and Annexin repeat-containing protein [Strongyloides ratti]|uniref:Annexin n=1 Tax=Strongyloides ratti TaxID=34506 RepID=A0A090LAN8_STRRB|nr:Annexin family and Annexin, type III family and Annexin repeat-containing protein [Strongyloides ratti]CEF64600.1 Annexin family and Annexin, type III family and Annexin repeat-containing protein [Strongyloides ratti]
MSGFGNFLTKSLKEAAEDLVKNKLSSFKGENKNDTNNMPQPKNNPTQPGQQPPYGGLQGSKQPQSPQQLPQQPPQQQPYLGGPGQQPYSGVPGQQPYSGGPGQQPYSGGPGQQPYSGGPGQQPYSGNVGQQPYSGGPGQQPYSGGPGQQPYSGGPGQQGFPQPPYGGPQPYGINPQVMGGYGNGIPNQPNYGNNPQFGQGFGGYGFPGSNMPFNGSGNMMDGGMNGYGGYNPSNYVNQMPPQQGGMILGNPSVKEYPGFNPSNDAESLRKAMKGFGCNNTRVVEIICKRTNLQRQQICRSFQQMYGKDLINELKSELYGDFEDLIIALMKPSAEYDATELHRAVDGLGTNENILIEIMTSRTNSQIRDIKNAYNYLYNTDLESDIKGDTSGYFKRLLIALSTGFRDESNYVDINNAQQSAKSLYSAGEGRLGTDESTFLGVLCSQNFAQLNAVFEEYHKLTGRTIDIAIKNEFSGDIKDGLLALYQIIVNRPGYFASQLENSMKGFGTRDKDLIRLVVSRCEIDMIDIRNEFQRMYGRSLEQTIEGDTSGSYKNALITLVKGN